MLLNSSKATAFYYCIPHLGTGSAFQPKSDMEFFPVTDTSTLELNTPASTFQAQ